MTIEERNSHILEKIIVSADYPTTLHFIDRSGQTFNGIEVIHYVGKDKNNKIYFMCRCTCGNEFIARSNKKVISCGCGECSNKNALDKIIDTCYPTSHNFKDLTGKKLYGIEVLKYIGMDKHHAVYYKCKCRCGNEFITMGSRLQRGYKLSCGCYRTGLKKYNNKTHRKNDPIYPIYAEMNNLQNEVCDEWIGPTGFETFRDWMISQGFEKGINILRKDPNKEYSSENCILVKSELSTLFLTNGIFVTIDEYTYPLPVWAKIVDIKYATIWARLIAGWTPRDSVLTPVKGKPGIDVIDYIIPHEIERLNGCGQ